MLACAREFKLWKGMRSNKHSVVYLSEDDKESMAEYWLRVRDQSPYTRVGELMLWWLSHPMGTAGVERDFCGLTMISRAFRRNRMGFTAFRAALLASCNKKVLLDELRAELLRRASH